jgi:ATP-dependent RNA circularization protein (DNA/RNA ligase family)
MLDQILSDMKSKVKNTTAEDTISKANPRNMQKEKDIYVKTKTEAANPYLQFLSDIRRKANGVPLKLKQLQDDWRKMSKAEKQVHVDKFNMEKAELGSNFRKDRKKHKKVKTDVSKIGKVSRKGLVKRIKSVKVKGSVTQGVEHNTQYNPTFESLLKNLEELDKDLDVISVTNDELKNQISSVETELAVKKHILEYKTDSHNAFKGKYDDIMDKHSLCFND